MVKLIVNKRQLSLQTRQEQLISAKHTALMNAPCFYKVFEGFGKSGCLIWFPECERGRQFTSSQN